MVREGPAEAAVQFAWRAEVTDDELVTLTRCHGGSAQAGWWDRIRPHSLGWVTARIDDGTLIGFVNVAWDGGDHAFLIDTKVRPDHQRRGIGTELVRIVARHAKEAGCEWMEVDFDEPLASFYYDACGFVATPAGLLHLPGLPPIRAPTNDEGRPAPPFASSWEETSSYFFALLSIVAASPRPI